MSRDRTEVIREVLNRAFSPSELRIKDQSHLHVGHAGAADGRGHFDVRIVSEAFRGLNRIARHRSVYQALGDLLKSDIHALRLHTLTPDESDRTGHPG